MSSKNEDTVRKLKERISLVRHHKAIKEIKNRSRYVTQSGVVCFGPFAERMKLKETGKPIARKRVAQVTKSSTAQRLLSLSGSELTSTINKGAALSSGEPIRKALREALQQASPAQAKLLSKKYKLILNSSLY